MLVGHVGRSNQWECGWNLENCPARGIGWDRVWSRGETREALLGNPELGNPPRAYHRVLISKAIDVIRGTFN